MNKAKYLKRIITFIFITLLLISCGNLNENNFTLSEEELKIFLKESDYNFLEIIEYISIEKNSSDLIIVYTSDEDPEFTKYEVALVNLKETYFEKINGIHSIPRVYKAKSLDDFVLISDSSFTPWSSPHWYPVLEHWQRSDRKDNFETTRETYIADVSLEEPEYDVYRLGSNYGELETGKLIEIDSENGVLKLIYRKHDWYVVLREPKTEIRYNKEKERFEINIKNTPTDINGWYFHDDEYLDYFEISKGREGDINLYLYPRDTWDKRFYVESEIILSVPGEDISIIQTKIILNVDHNKDDF